MTPDRYEVTSQAWDKVAAAYQDKFMNVNLYDDTYDAFCRLVKQPNAQVLEIGCGPGNITRYLLARRPDFRVLGIDIAPGMIELARANNPTAEFQVMDGRQIGTLQPARFDAIMCGFCLPYLSKEDCAQLLRNSAALLNDGGVAYFSAIAGDYAQSGYQTSSSGLKMYVYYYQETDLREALTDSGFEVVELRRVAFPQAPEPSAAHLVFIVRRG